ncbi:MAG: glycosyltransferase family 39 protein [Phycisphaeraceae bacterium]|nr:glycosyltransferase family 39 protein [Phycisphaeraceae bacterium]
MSSIEDTRPMMPLDGHADPDAHHIEIENRTSAAWWLGLLVLTALGLRLLVFALGPAADTSLAQHPDSTRYEMLAANLISDHAFAVDTIDPQSPMTTVDQLRSEAGQLESPQPNGKQPEIYLTPGYPAFLAAIQSVGFGAGAVLIIQSLLSALCVVLTYKLTSTLLKSTTAGLLAGVVVAIHPGMVTMSNVLLPQVLWLTLMLGGLWLIVSSEKQPTASMAIGGLLMGAAALVQPYALVLLALLGLWSMLRVRRLSMVAAAVVMVVAGCLPPGLWMARNFIVGAGPILSSQPIIDGYYHTVADMRRLPADSAERTLTSELVAARQTDENVLAAIDRLTGQTIRENPTAYLVMMWRHAAHLTTGHSLGELYRQVGMTYQPPLVQQRILTEGLAASVTTESSDLIASLLAMSWIGFNLLLALAAIVGLPLLVMRGHWSAALLALLLIGATLASMHSGLYDQPRVLACCFEAALAAGIVAPSLRVRTVKTKTSRQEKLLKRELRRQQQCLGIEDLASQRDPIMPGHGPREGVRPI